MSTFTFTNLRDAGRAIWRDAKAREQRVLQAVPKAARNTARYVVKETVPKAFGELVDSIHTDAIRPGQADIIADAPHAAAVETGSRPHTPPLAPLIAWVMLRGVQGLTGSGRVTRSKDKNLRAARSVANALRGHFGTAQAAAQWRAHASHAVKALTPQTLGQIDADPAVVAVARAIQAKITKYGTKPTRFMGQGVPVAEKLLDQFVREALPDR